MRSFGLGGWGDRGWLFSVCVFVCGCVRRCVLCRWVGGSERGCWGGRGCVYAPRNDIQINKEKRKKSKQNRKRRRRKVKGGSIDPHKTLCSSQTKPRPSALAIPLRFVVLLPSFCSFFVRDTHAHTQTHGRYRPPSISPHPTHASSHRRGRTRPFLLTQHIHSGREGNKERKGKGRETT
jgi:hypothetical protein